VDLLSCGKRDERIACKTVSSTDAFARADKFVLDRPSPAEPKAPARECGAYSFARRIADGDFAFRFTALADTAPGPALGDVTEAGHEVLRSAEVTYAGWSFPLDDRLLACCSDS